MSCGCRLGLARVNAQAYADDLVILSPTLTGLQLIVDRFVTLADKLELSINVNKTCYMIFNDRFKNVFMPTILVHGEPLKRVSNFKYLGCILTDDLSKLMEEFLGNLRDKKIMARMVIKSISNYSIFSIYFLKIFLYRRYFKRNL